MLNRWDGNGRFRPIGGPCNSRCADEEPSLSHADGDYWNYVATVDSIELPKAIRVSRVLSVSVYENNHGPRLKRAKEVPDRTRALSKLCLKDLDHRIQTMNRPLDYRHQGTIGTPIGHEHIAELPAHETVPNSNLAARPQIEVAILR